MKKLVKALLIIVVIALVVVAGIGAWLTYVLPDTNPAPRISIEPLPENIERGKYLANNVAACMVCHTHRDFSFFGGPVDSTVFGAGGDRFDPSMVPGRVYTTNVTPHSLSEWTDGEIYRAITEGVKKDGSAIFPIMPYRRYGKMTAEDAFAIVAYLRTLKPIGKEIPPSSNLDFPWNFTVNTYPEKAAHTEKIPDTSNSVEYGKYLVNIANCVQCHSKPDNKIDIVEGTEFGGGQVYYLKHGAAYSANITPDEETGIGKWSKEYFIQQFKRYATGTYTPFKPKEKEFNSPMPWLAFANMKESDLSAIYDYLRTVKPIKNKVEKWKPE